ATRHVRLPPARGRPARRARADAALSDFGRMAAMAPLGSGRAEVGIMAGRITLAVAALVAVLLIVAAFICARAAHASNCAVTSVGFVPLTDLGAGTYHGFPA